MRSLAEWALNNFTETLGRAEGVGQKSDKLQGTILVFGSLKFGN